MEIRNKYNVINIMENLANSDLGRVIAGYKFYDLINTFNAAVFSLNEGSKCSDCANKRFYFSKIPFWNLILAMTIFGKLFILHLIFLKI